MKFFALFIIAALISSSGFKKFVWFLSLGYGFSMAAIGAALLVMHWGAADAASVALCLLLVVYGVRLGSYLVYRELNNANYNKVLNAAGGSAAYPLPLLVVIWLTCALLYACEASPVLWRLQAGVGVDALGVIGAAIAICGIALEAAADLQKNAAKKVNPHRFVDTGLYSFVRCPNYLGEVLTWTGMLVSGLGAMQTPWQWAAALFGWVGIVYVMFGGARRLEIRQNKNYGADPEYQAYVRRVPIILPFVPLYSVEKYTWLRG
ncbi:DUF1295 domain-containing protein [Paratractidigestivibacter sp.]|uniref:DUF1295 domain-containing protein n=1 Tax=Paratractidigestivibacter sp. TaxID=2847316 RepID=UPI002ABDAB5D|nr:DUF1295 domain-containing protein [Paratractidigestivibacter sp.]